MAIRARKTEHGGSKKGSGTFWGRKREAKEASNRRRRETDNSEARNRGESQA